MRIPSGSVGRTFFWSAGPAIASQVMGPVVSAMSYRRRASTAMSSWGGLRPTRVSMIPKQIC